MKRNRHTITPTFALTTQCVAGGFLVECAEVIDTSNRYTSAAKTGVVFLKDIEEFCHFIEILQGGSKYDLIQLFSTNTCFDPTCKDVKRDLFEQGSIYKASLQQGTKITAQIENMRYLTIFSEALDKNGTSLQE